MPNLPTAADLRARLEACRVRADVLDDLDLDGAVEAAIAEWERITGFSPWLASSEPETLRFNTPSCRKLELETGVVEIVSIRCDGRTLTEGDDYSTWPRRALATGQPITLIEWLDYWPGYKVEIVARVGYCNELDAKVFNLILDGAGAELGEQIGAALAYVESSEGGEIKSQSTGDTKIEFSTSSAAKTSAMKYEPEVWKSRFEKGARQRRLIVVGLND